MSKLQLSLLVVLFTSLKAFSQIEFQPGYFIDNTGDSITTLIRNIGWKNNPSQFEYRQSPDAIVYKGGLETVQEFAITGGARYVRAHVKIDKTLEEIHHLKTERNPVFEDDTVFLKVLLDGNAGLYKYEEGNLTRFFYNIGSSPITQLVYKRYLTSDNKPGAIDDKIGTNNAFRQQLYSDLKCPGIEAKDVKSLKYNERELLAFFRRYNSCTGSVNKVYQMRDKRDRFNLSLRPGVNYSRLEITQTDGTMLNTEFDPKLTVRLGIEAEFILPYNRNKWAVLVEPTYQYFTSKQSTPSKIVSGGIVNSEVHYESIEVPVGLRHYFFINKTSKIFVDAVYFFEFQKKSKIDYSRSDGSAISFLDISARPNIGLGVGYKFADKIAVQVRYLTPREILGGYLQMMSDYNTTSFIVGYTIF